MSLNVKANFPFFKNLKCAYTGNPVEVRMVSAKARPPVYFSPDAFDPGEFVPTSQQLFALLGFRDGVDGAASGTARLVCPYTGAEMTIEHVPGLGYHAIGGFRPSIPMSDPAAFAKAMLRRRGEAPADAPESARVQAVEREDTSPEEGPAQVSRDLALEHAESVLKDKLPVKTSVVVPGRKGRNQRT